MAELVITHPLGTLPPAPPASLALTFPSRISCFRLLISFFSSKLAASSFWGWGGGRGHYEGPHLEGSTLDPKDQLPNTHNLTFPPHHVDLCENLQHLGLLH